MFCDFDGAEARPKRLDLISEAIFNNQEPPDELLRFTYRRLFGLSAAEIANEPMDEFYTNLFIYAEMQKKEELMNKHG